jgi:carbon starvation protein
LAVGIAVVMPDMKMPAVTRFIDGTGPVFSGSLFPFLFITIACGSVSGFHALIASGTTPKMIESESQVALIGYGGMLMESFVAVMAMVAASVIEPGVYFAMNSPGAVIGTDLVTAAAKISSWGFVVTPEMLAETAKDVGEATILSRAGGAPTLAVGMAQIFSSVIGGKAMMGFWYHFAILFEALFILTAVDAGTRACRFMVQDMVGAVIPAFRATKSWGNNLIATGIAVAMWGYILYGGVTDPFGGINSLWPLFGISNQMLAGMALITIAVILVKMKRQRYAWVPALPAVWLLICTTYAGVLKVVSADPRIGFWAQAERFRAAINEGKILGPAKTMDQMHQVMVNNYLDAVLAAAFVMVVISMVIYGVLAVRKALASPTPTAVEIGGPVEARHA